MKNVTIEQSIKDINPLLRLGILEAEIIINKSDKELWNHIQSEIKKKSIISSEFISKSPNILASRNVYKKLGKDPSRYRPSAESLLRRIVSGKGLYDINNVVNIINLVSIQSGFSIGAYDNFLVDGDIRLSMGTNQDIYEALGKGILNIEFLPVLRDLKGAFGSPTSDSERTGIREHCRKCLLVFFDFESNENLIHFLEKTVFYLKEYASGVNFEKKIVY